MLFAVLSPIEMAEALTNREISTRLLSPGAPS
jgi:hypothetical protein